MKAKALLLGLMIAANGFAQGVIDVHSHIITPEFVSSLEKKGTNPITYENMIVRIAEIEVYPQYLEDKQGTLHMVKDLKLPTMKPLDPETMKLIFKKQR